MAAKKLRKVPKRRNLVIRDMIVRAPSSFLRDRRKRRPKDRRNDPITSDERGTE